jgi:diguanylate cyclase (GGDEF)-like protein
MTHRIDFDSMDMGKYVRMLKQVLGKDLVCGVIDEQYEKHWDSGSEDSQLIDKILAQAKAQKPWLFPGRIHDLCPDDRLALVHGLDLEDLESNLYFIGLVPRDIPGVSTIHGAQRYFSDVASCMGSQHNVTMENEKMIQELSQRYEELNLIYQTDEYAKNNLNTGKSLENVVRDITEFMEVDGAFLLLPAMGHWVFQTNQTTDLLVKKSQIREMVKKIFDVVTQTGQAHVVNKKELFGGDKSLGGSFIVMASPVMDSGFNNIGVIGCLRRQEGQDFVTGDRKLMQVIAQRVRKIIHSDLDILTGLADRVSFENKLQTILAEASRIRNHTAVCFFNIDQFKLLNDAYGMAAGDAVLKQLSIVLKEHFREQDFLARIKGDEFAVILSDMPQGDHSREVLERIRKGVARQKYQFQNAIIHITMRMGLVNITREIKDAAEIIVRGEIAVEAAQEKGGDCISVFKDGDAKLAEKQTQADFATQMEELVKNRQFVLFCQPIIPLQGGNMHYEILIRLKDKTGQMIAPYLFLPAAERSNKMPFIDEWVLEETCRILKSSKSFLNHAKISWAINISGQSLQDEAFLNYFLFFLSQLDFPASWLNFEITETVAIRNFDRVIHVIEQVQAMGFSISLDDFGSGYSSFGYLKKLPISFLKIDGMFIQNLHTDPLAQVMVQSIVSIAKHLKIQTIAEFVENQSILDLLKQWGVDYSQAYHTGIQKQDFCREI